MDDEQMMKRLNLQVGENLQAPYRTLLVFTVLAMAMQLLSLIHI